MNNINLYKIVVEWVLFIIQQLTDLSADSTIASVFHKRAIKL